MASSSETSLKGVIGAPKESLPSRCTAFIALTKYTIESENDFFFGVLSDLLCGCMAGSLLPTLSPYGAGCAASVFVLYLLRLSIFTVINSSKGGLALGAAVDCPGGCITGGASLSLMLLV